MKVLVVVLWLAVCAYGQEAQNPYEKRIAFLEAHVEKLNGLLDTAIANLGLREQEIRSLKAELVRVQVAPVAVPCVPAMADRINMSDAWGRVGSRLWNERVTIPAPAPVIPPIIGVRPLFQQTICTSIGSGLNCTTY